MQLTITGRHVKVTEPIKEHINRKAEHFTKYFDRIIDVHAILSVEKYRQCAEITVFGKNLSITESSVATDMYAAIDDVCGRVEVALRRHKDKIKGHRKKDSAKMQQEIVDEDEGGQLQ